MNVEANYQDDIIKISRFNSQCEDISCGVNVPVLLKHECSDEVTRRTMMKSGDDGRQDMVIEQVFDVVNEILKSNYETRKHGMQLITYKV